MLIDGRKIAVEIKAEIAAEVRRMVDNGCRPPHLSAVLVGHDSASETYVANKMKACQECGITANVVRFDSDVTQEQLLQAVAALNSDHDVDGFIVQLPLPQQVDEQAVIEAVDYRKDVDGFHPINVGRLALGLPCYQSTTAQGILTLLHHYGIATEGKHCVVLGRGNLVGRPAATLLMQKSYPGNCTVTVCHSATKNLTEITRMADILIVAIGVPRFVTPDMVKDGAVVLDVGTTRVHDDSVKGGWKFWGDVDFDAVAPKCKAISPVPGGVGPMTIASLLRNTLLAATGGVYPRN